MKKENVEIFDDSNIVTLYDEEEKPIDFYEVACIELNDKYYGLMQPVEPMEGLAEDEAVIFEIQHTEGEEDDMFIPLFDEQVLEAVFNEYMEAAACECGGDCRCDGECDCDDGCGDECDCEDGGCGCHHHHEKE